MNLSENKTKMSVQAEQLMDSSKLSYVFLTGSRNRLSMSHECMEAFGLKVGQTISGAIFIETLKWNLADCQTKIALKKAAETASEST